MKKYKIGNISVSWVLDTNGNYYLYAGSVMFASYKYFCRNREECYIVAVKVNKRDVLDQCHRKIEDEIYCKTEDEAKKVCYKILQDFIKQLTE